jgi:predicted dehydrogenase
MVPSVDQSSEVNMSSMRVAIIGASGYARTHHSAVEHASGKGLCKLEAVAMPRPYRDELGEPEKAAQLAERGVRVYDTYQELLAAEKGRVDLVTVPTGIAMHAPISIAALNAGYHVYCEKPMAGTVSEARRMLEAESASGKTLCMGYQHLSRPTIQTITELKVTGRYGALRSAKCRVLWPRPNKYYRRNDWAGRIDVQGTRIYDSPLQNATAHFLQNMLYVAGPDKDSVAWPRSVYAENYRANHIESADTQFIRISTEDAVTVEMWVTHAANQALHPSIEFEFEEARVVWPMRGDAIVYRGSDEVERIEGSDVPESLLIIEDVLTSLPQGRAPHSTGVNSIQHVAAVNAAFTASEPSSIPQQYLHGSNLKEEIDLTTARAQEDDVVVVIDDIEGIISNLYKDREGFAEAAIPWARAGKTVDVEQLVRSTRS